MSVDTVLDWHSIGLAFLGSGLVVHAWNLAKLRRDLARVRDELAALRPHYMFPSASMGPRPTKDP